MHPSGHLPRSRGCGFRMVPLSVKVGSRPPRPDPEVPRSIAPRARSENTVERSLGQMPCLLAPTAACAPRNQVLPASGRPLLRCLFPAAAGTLGMGVSSGTFSSMTVTHCQQAKATIGLANVCWMPTRCRTPSQGRCVPGVRMTKVQLKTSVLRA